MRFQVPRRFAVLAFLTICVGVVSSRPAASDVVIDGQSTASEAGGQSISRHFLYLADPKTELTIGEIGSGRHDTDFLPLGARRSTILPSRATHWLKVIFQNTSTVPASRILDINFPNLHDVTLFVPRVDGSFQARISNVRTGERDSDYPARILTWKLDFPAQSRATYYLRVSGPMARFPINLSTLPGYIDQSRTDAVFHGILIAILLVTWLYQMIQLAITRDNSHAPFLVFVTFACLFEFTALGYQYLVFDELGRYFTLCWLLTQSLLGVAAVQFYRKSVDLSKTVPLANKILGPLIYLSLIVGLFSLINYPVAFVISRYIFFATVLIIGLSVFWSVFVLNNSHSYINFIALLPVLLTSSAAILNVLGWLGAEPLSPVLTPMGLSATVLCFLFLSAREFANQRHDRATSLAREEQLFDLLTISPIGVLICQSFGGEILFTNPQAEKMLGQGKNSMAGGMASSILADEHVENELTYEFRRQGEITESEVEFHGAENRTFWGLLTVQNIQFAGKPCVINWIYDVDQRKTFETILRLRERDFRSLAENSIQGVLIVSKEQQPLFANRKVAQIFGYGSPEEIISLGTTRLLIPSHELSKVDQYRPRIFGGEFLDGVNYELEGAAKDGSLIWIEVRAGATWWKGERANHLAITDISWRKQAEAKVIKARDSAEAASAAKTTFLATLSHEIRTPMNGILGMARLLASGHLESSQRKLAETLLDAGNKLGSFLDDILDLSKLEASALQVEAIAFDLRSITEEVTGLMRSRIQEKNLSLNVHVDEKVPPRLLGDPTRIRQIFYNLLDNAIKFTVNGRVDVAIRYDLEVQNGRLIIEVKDTGVGVPADVRKRMFEDFVQGDSAMYRRFGGSGLGLAITKRLVERMEGRISHHNRPGGGTVFVVVLPVPIASVLTLQASENVPDDPAARKLRILVAEDDETSALVISGYANLFGHQTTLVQTGAEAVRLFEQEDFDLVLMDIQMPDMDGIEATKLIRTLEEPSNAETPIFALTADVTRQAEDKALSAGMNGILHKPLTPEHLVSAIQRISDPYSTSSVQGNPELEKPSPDVLDQSVIARMITDLGEERVELLLGTARTTYHDMTVSLRDHLERSDLDREMIGKIAHKMSGTTSSAGLFCLAETIRDLESKTLRGESPEEIFRLVNRIDQLAAQSFAAMSDYMASVSASS